MNLKIDEQFTLSDIRSTDKPAYLEYLQDRQIYERTLNIPYPYTERDADSWIQLNIAATKSQNGRSVNWAIRRADGKLVGGVGFLGLQIGVHHKAELGYWLAKPYWNGGLMTKAVRKAVKYAFEEFGLIRITANVFEFNGASARVLEKTGFRCEGYLRSHYHKDGKLFDGLLFAILKDDVLRNENSAATTFRFTVLAEICSVTCLEGGHAAPDWATTGAEFSAVVRTPDETSIVSPTRAVPDGLASEAGWRVLKIEGTLDFAMIGVISSVTTALAKAGVSVFVVSTFKTDYILVRERHLEAAVRALESEGHQVQKNS